MKTLFNTILLLALAVTTGFAQTTQPTHKGTWVIESNVKTPRIQTIKFYNADLKLVHQETFTKKKLNLNNRKVRAQLDKMTARVVNGDSAIKNGTVTASLK